MLKTNTYNLGGGLTSYNNDSRFTITQAFDTAGRVTSLTSSFVDANHPATLTTVGKYWPSGAPELLTYGNNLSELRFLNNRFQLCRINVNTGTPALLHCSDDIPSGTVQDFYLNYNEGTADNGNLALWSASDGQTFHRTYTYDPLNRISTVSDSAAGQTCKGLQWTYDVWGNRTDQTTTSGSCGESHLNFDINNRISAPGFTYDAAGNLTHDASHSYIYDAENRLTQVDGGSTATYVYDANGRRVRKVVGSTTIDYVYDLGGHVVLDALPNGFWTTGYVYLNGHLVAQYSGASTGTTDFVHHDHLGSTRLLTAVNQSVYDSVDYLPFGEQIAGATGTSHKFTGYERDSETGLDYAFARHMGSSLGRFIAARATATRCAWPCDNCEGFALALSCRERLSRSPVARALSDGNPARKDASRRFSSTFRLGTRCSFCGTIPTERPRQRSSAAPSSLPSAWPPTSISPSLGLSSPATRCRSVVLPLPEAPSTSQRSPAAASKRSSARTSRAP